jgi:excisionase family DNA binding protein
MTRFLKVFGLVYSAVSNGPGQSFDMPWADRYGYAATKCCAVLHRHDKVGETDQMAKKIMRQQPLIQRDDVIVPGLLSVEQTCAYLNLGRSSVWELLGNGEIRAISYGRRKLAPVAELNRFIERRIADEYGDAA